MRPNKCTPERVTLNLVYIMYAGAIYVAPKAHPERRFLEAAGARFGTGNRVLFQRAAATAVLVIDPAAAEYHIKSRHTPSPESARELERRM
jgi:hypothetical protein